MRKTVRALLVVKVEDVRLFFLIFFLNFCKYFQKYAVVVVFFFLLLFSGKVIINITIRSDTFLFINKLTVSDFY